MSIKQDELKELLDYNPESGEFTWKVDRTRIKAGNKAGTKHKSGYTTISVNGKIYYTAKLAILWMDGFIPKRTALKNKTSSAYKDIVVIE